VVSENGSYGRAEPIDRTILSRQSLPDFWEKSLSKVLGEALTAGGRLGWGRRDGRRGTALGKGGRGAWGRKESGADGGSRYGTVPGSA